TGAQGFSGDGGLATTAKLTGPYAVAVDVAGDFLIADSQDPRVLLVAADSCSFACPYGLSSMTAGHIYTVAGNGISGFSGDGQRGTGGELAYPTGVAVDSRGDALIADTANNRVRLVAASSCSQGCPYGL